MLTTWRHMAKAKKPKKEVFAYVAPDHGVYWRENYKDCATEDDFLKHVCNNAVILPQKKQGFLVHHPCHDLSEDPFVEARFGWQEGKSYLLVLPSPSIADIAGMTSLCTTDPVSDFVRTELETAGIPIDQVMVTYACRFGLPTGVNAYNAGHKNTCAPYVRADVNALKPKVIITFGSDALKTLLGKTGKLDTYRGGVEYYNGMPIVMMETPKQFMFGYAGIEVFRAELLRAKSLADGTYIETRLPTDGYRVVTTVAQMEELVADVEASGTTRIAFDFEFGSLVKRDEHTIVRSCQISWAKGKAAFIMFRKCGGHHVYDDMSDYDHVWALLHRLLRNPAYQLAGHHLRTDVNRMWYAGYSIDEKLATGFCSMLAYHLLHGDDNIGLDQACRRDIPEAGAYWRDLELWLDRNERKKQLAYGYLTVPDEIIIPYGLCDADVAWREAEILEERLKQFPRLHTLFVETTMPTALHMMDLERQGIQVDEAKRMEIRSIIKPEYEAILAEFKELIRWPDCPNDLPNGVEPWPNFDQAKSWQIASLVYSDTDYKEKKPLPYVLIDGSLEQVTGLGLTPPYNNDKYPKQWSEVVDAQEEYLNKPSTKIAAIELLMTDNPDVEALRYIKWLAILGKYLNTYLTPQTVDAETNLPTSGSSFSANICDDGRVRTNLHQTSDTGRWRSTKPNLQCNPKKQDAAVLECFVYRRFGGMSLGEYKDRCDRKRTPEDHPDFIPKDKRIHLPSFKEVYVPRPGYVFVEADFATAELAIWAFCSGDPVLTKIIEQDRDLHLEVATDCFQLPIKEELNAALDALDKGDPSLYKAWKKAYKDKYEVIRNVTKSVNFGIIYGRSAGALSREINKQGIPTTKQQCQEVIDGVATKFAVGWAWLLDAQKQALECGYVENGSGFRRWFTEASKLGNTQQAKIKRQAPNSRIQGMVAYLLCRAGINLYNFRYKTRNGRDLAFYPNLPIHDAYLVEARQDFWKQTGLVLKMCMSKMNVIPTTGGKTLGVDLSGIPLHSWGEH